VTSESHDWHDFWWAFSNWLRIFNEIPSKKLSSAPLGGLSSDFKILNILINLNLNKNFFIPPKIDNPSKFTAQHHIGIKKSFHIALQKQHTRKISDSIYSFSHNINIYSKSRTKSASHQKFYFKSSHIRAHHIIVDICILWYVCKYIIFCKHYWKGMYRGE
jgi:hypothetical protein